MTYTDAHARSLELVTYTCGPVKDVMVILKDKYGISNDDYDFALRMLTEQTKRLRRALVRQIEGESGGTHGD